MQIVIDIPEEYYDALRKANIIISGKRNGKTLESVIYNAVGNGTLFPDILKDIKADLWMEGMNMAGEYQGIWVRYKNIEKVIDKYISKAKKVR